MKVALCLYGALREFNKVRDCLRQHVLTQNSVDLFAYLWTESLLGLYPSETSHPRYSSGIFSKSCATEFFTLNPKQCFVTSSINGSLELQQAFASQRDRIGSQIFGQFPLHYWANLYAQEQAVNLASEFADDYAFTVVSRADVLYLDSLLLNQLKTEHITVHKKFGAGRPSDFWYAAPSHWCQVISKRFSTFPTLSAEVENHPLTLFQNKISEHNFPIFFADLPIDMVQRRYTGWWWTPYERDPSIVKDIG